MAPWLDAGLISFHHRVHVFLSRNEVHYIRNMVRKAAVVSQVSQ